MSNLKIFSKLKKKNLELKKKNLDQLFFVFHFKMSLPVLYILWKTICGCFHQKRCRKE